MADVALAHVGDRLAGLADTAHQRERDAACSCPRLKSLGGPMGCQGKSASSKTGPSANPIAGSTIAAVAMPPAAMRAAGEERPPRHRLALEVAGRLGLRQRLRAVGSAVARTGNAVRPPVGPAFGLRAISHRERKVAAVTRFVAPATPRNRTLSGRAALQARCPSRRTGARPPQAAPPARPGPRAQRQLPARSDPRAPRRRPAR